MKLPQEHHWKINYTQLGHTDNGYGGLYTIYQTSDVDTWEWRNRFRHVFGKPNGTDPYIQQGLHNDVVTILRKGCYNREHIIPQSTFGSAAPMVSDAHFITPTDGKVNGQRSSYPRNSGTTTWISLNGSKLGSSSVAGYSGTVFWTYRRI
jgi:hypothetical protein